MEPFLIYATAGQIASLLFFSICSISFGALLICSLLRRAAGVISPRHDHVEAEKPISPRHGHGSPLFAASRDFSELGLYLLIAFICEKFPIFAHSQRLFENDTFWWTVALVPVLMFARIQSGKGADVLNRDQTDEWKGWMQFVFVWVYHYQSNERRLNLYNIVRVLVSAYVWLTGFGNFRYFSSPRGDLSFARIVRMMWRLNFLVFFLCLVMNNDYILYYITFLHSFHFLLVCGAFAVVKQSSAGHRMLQAMIVILAIVIFVIWDVPGVFKRTLGALLPESWFFEWHFRTYLDHFTSLLGMVFGFNFVPYMKWLETTEAGTELRAWSGRMARGTMALVLIGCTLVWGFTILPLDKFSYNSWHPYTNFGPLVAYVFLRNISPVLRQRHSGLMAALGRISLEAYLMQHHILLSSNAKKLLTIVPGYPIINGLVVSGLFIPVCMRLKTLTERLQEFCLPSDAAALRHNLLTCCGVCTGLGALAFAVKGMEPSYQLAAFLGMVLMGSFALLTYADSSSWSFASYKQVTTVMFVVLITTAVAFHVSDDEGLSIQRANAWLNAYSGGFASSEETDASSQMNCVHAVGKGSYGKKEGWVWDSEVQKECAFTVFKPSQVPEVLRLMSGRRFIFLGDALLLQPLRTRLACILLKQCPTDKVEQVGKIPTEQKDPITLEYYPTVTGLASLVANLSVSNMASAGPPVYIVVMSFSSVENAATEAFDLREALTALSTSCDQGSLNHPLIYVCTSVHTFAHHDSKWYETRGIPFATVADYYRHEAISTGLNEGPWAFLDVNEYSSDLKDLALSGTVKTDKTQFKPEFYDTVVNLILASALKADASITRPGPSAECLRSSVAIAAAPKAGGKPKFVGCSPLRGGIVLVMVAAMVYLEANFLGIEKLILGAFKRL